MDLIILNPNDEDLELNKEKYNTGIRKPLVKSTSKKSSTNIASSDVVAAAASTSKDVNKQKRSHTQADGLGAAKHPKSIQDDPNPDVSSVFKSLYTTCEKAKNQQKHHWVTNNLQYN